MDDRITEPQAKFSSQSQRQHSREIRAHTAELRTHRGMEQRHKYLQPDPPRKARSGDCWGLTDISVGCLWVSLKEEEEAVAEMAA